MRLFFLVSLWLAFSCSSTEKEQNKDLAIDFSAEKTAIASRLDSFNLAAASADFDQYFGFYSADAVFMGTDATEYWTKDEFQVWAKPFFDKKKTWNFKAMKRNIYFGNHPDLAWFDELLNTQMKICRGSGVMVKENGVWKVKQYVLSMTFPNEQIKGVLELKGTREDSIIDTLSR